MKINKGEISTQFYGHFYQFAKFNTKYYDDAVVIQRWESPAAPELKPECVETPYGGERYINFTLKIPKPVCPICTGTIIILRMSKNRYRAAFDNGKTVAMETFATIKEIALYTESFFK